MPFPILPSNSATGYNLTRSLRLRGSASAYLNRTPSSAGNRRTFTVSYWMKRGTLGTTQYVFSAGSGTTESTWFTVGTFDTNGSSFDSTLASTWTTGGGTTTAVFRDPSAWYHFVWAIDTTQATASNRVKLWVNGVQQTLSTPAITQNADLAWNNSGVVHYIGARIDSGPRQFFDGYLADIYNIDGQALTPSSFGSTNSTTGVWQPARYTGTYGTNGFYLPFTDNSTTTTLGNDFSGNGNNWTTNNISLTAGATYDSMTDVPTLTSATTANYCVMNPLAVTASNGTISNANLTVTTILTGGGNGFGTFALPTSGKYYWEVTPTAVAGTCMIGVGTISTASSYFWQNTNGSLGYFDVNGDRYLNGGGATYGASYTTNDVIGVAVDLDAGTVTFYKNNTSQGAITFNASGLFPAVSDGSGSGGSSVFNINFGQQPFTYTPPTGFNRLNTFNLPTPTIGASASTLANKNFDATTYTGTGAAQNIVNSGSMQTDFVWIKSRSVAGSNHELYDSVRGAGQFISSSTAGAEATISQAVTSFNANGFSLGNGTSSNSNTSGASLVAWQWRAGGTAVTNTAGTISAQVSANASAGFSIVTFSAQATAGTVGHGLGVAPSMILMKDRGAAFNWLVYTNSTGAGKYLILNTTSATLTASTVFSTAPTSSVFDPGTGIITGNGYGNQVAYCFSQIAGYSAFGSYTGNGSTDGPFVFTGFRPRYIMAKRTDLTSSWVIMDTSRDPFNVMSQELTANTASAEVTFAEWDALSNGFKLRQTSAGLNASGGTYIYMAFAENPFKYSLAR